MGLKALSLFVAAAGVLVASPGFAHHGASGYDSSKMTILKATITTVSGGTNVTSKFQKQFGYIEP